MHVGHEFVKVHAALANDGTRFEEEVHQHGLAATDLAVDVKSFQRRAALLALAKQPAERRRFAREPVLIEPQLKRAQLPCQRGLAGIRFDFSGGDQCRVAGAEKFRTLGQRQTDWRERCET